MYGYQAWGLIDTGSEHNLLAEPFLSLIQENHSGPLFTCPIAPVNLRGVVTTKRCPINQQCFIEITIENQSILTTILIVPGLSIDIILGCDWCDQAQVAIDFSENRHLCLGKRLITLHTRKERGIEIGAIEVIEKELEKITNGGGLLGEREAQLSRLLRKYTHIFSE